MAPEIRDNEDEMVRLLRQIAANTGSLDDLDGPRNEITIKGQSVKSRVGTIDPKNMVVVETDNMEGAESDGSMEVEPGETVTFVKYRGDPFAVLAVGATDKTDVTYQLRVDGRTPIGGTTNSPLGALNDPLSFVDKLGGAPHAEQTVEYQAHLSSAASAPVYVVGRLYVEGLTPP